MAPQLLGLGNLLIAGSLLGWTFSDWRQAILQQYSMVLGLLLYCLGFIIILVETNNDEP